MYLKVISNHYLYVAECVKEHGQYREKILYALGSVFDWDSASIAELKSKLPELKNTSDINSLIESVRMAHKDDGFTPDGDSLSNQSQPSNQQEHISLSHDDGEESQPYKSTPLISYSELIIRYVWNNIFDLNRFIAQLPKDKAPASFNISNVLCFIVANQIVSPDASISRLYAERDHILANPMIDMSLKEVYSVVDFATAFGNQILAHAVKQIYKTLNWGKICTIHFDCTNVFFETDLSSKERFIMNLKHDITMQKIQEGEDLLSIDDYFLSEEFEQLLNQELTRHSKEFMRMYGVSKENRHQPLVGLALATDADGLPIDFEVYPGNLNEHEFIVNSSERIKQAYGMDNVYYVADCGLKSDSNIRKLYLNQQGFVVGAPVASLGKHYRREMLCESGWINLALSNDESLLFSDYVKEDNPLALPVKICDYICNYEEVDICSLKLIKKQMTCKIIFTYSEKRHKRMIEKNLQDFNAARLAIQQGKYLDVPTGSGWRRFAVTAKEQATNKEDKEKFRAVGSNIRKLQNANQIAGYYAIIISPTDLDKDKSDEDLAKFALRIHKKHVNIESCFRILKNNLVLRPVYFTKNEHIKGYFAISILALLVLTSLQTLVDLNLGHKTINQIQATLSSALLIPEIKYNNLDSVIFTRTSGKNGAENTKALNIDEIMSTVGMKPFGLNKTIDSKTLRALLHISNREQLLSKYMIDYLKL